MTNTTQSKMPQISLQEFYDLLQAHDWWYEYSDDGAVWRRGRANQTKLNRIADENDANRALYNEWYTYMITNNGKGTKPQRPGA